jgi:hypothetical protein
VALLSYFNAGAVVVNSAIVGLTPVVSSRSNRGAHFDRDRPIYCHIWPISPVSGYFTGILPVFPGILLVFPGILPILGRLGGFNNISSKIRV